MLPPGWKRVSLCEVAEVPQADSLPKVRALLAELETTRNVERAGRAVGLSPRHADYYFAAAEALGFAKEVDAGPVLSATGKKLLATAARSAAEGAAFREAIAKMEALGKLGVTLLVPTAPSKRALADRIAAQHGLSPSTAARRADTLLRWRKYVLAIERQPELPNTRAVSSSAVYAGRRMLRSIRIESFKAFGGKNPPTVALGPLTVLVGPNGAGKSTILQALDVLGALVRGNITQMLDSHGWDYDDLPHLRSARQTISIQVTVEIGQETLEWTLTLGTRKHAGVAEEHVRARRTKGADWRTLLDREGRRVAFLDESSGEVVKVPPSTVPQSWLGTRNADEDAKTTPGLLALKDWAERIHALWVLAPSNLRAPSRGDTERVGSHGGDLASFLFRLKKRDPKKFSAFEKRVAHYYPRLVQIAPKSAEYGWKHVDIAERWNGETAIFNARQVSDGLLRLMAVASIPDWQSPPSIVLLDEIENGLHPAMLGGIADLLRDISKTTQVVTTTHSPITLNYVAPESTLVVTRGRGGAVLVTPLVKTRNYDKLREHFEPGELWYNAGEERLVGKVNR